LAAILHSYAGDWAGKAGGTAAVGNGGSWDTSRGWALEHTSIIRHVVRSVLGNLSLDVFERLGRFCTLDK